MCVTADYAHQRRPRALVSDVHDLGARLDLKQLDPEVPAGADAR